MSLAEFQQRVRDMVPDQDANVTADVQGRAIEDAVLQYGADLPRMLTEDVVWPERGVFGPVPASWDDGAAVRSAEYPVGQVPPSHIFVTAYSLPAGGWGLESVWAVAAGALVRVTFSLPHVLDAGTDTIPAGHRQAVAQYAAYLLCQQLATRYSGERETAVGAEVARTESRAKAYAARAKEYRSAYFAGTGQSDPFEQAKHGTDLAPAATVVSWPGRRRFGLTPRGVL